MLSVNDIKVQFGAHVLFEKISLKFNAGCRYGLIGANGSGKSTFIKVLAGDLVPIDGQVIVEPNIRIGKLRQDQFAFEDQSVLHVVMQGHQEMWQAMSERDAIYANPSASEADYLHAAELEEKFASYGGYAAEAKIGELLSGVGITLPAQQGLMRHIAPGWKLRVLLAQALFSNPDILLLDEPTNHLDINTIRWLEETLNNYGAMMVIISHDRHFLNAVCTHIMDLDYQTIGIYPGNYDDYMLASTQSRTQQLALNAKAKEQIQTLQSFVARFSANKSKARQATSRVKQVEKIKSSMIMIKPSTRQYPFIRFEVDKHHPLHRQAVEIKQLSQAFDKPLFCQLNLMLKAGQRLAIIGPNGSGKSTLVKLLYSAWHAASIPPILADTGTIQWSEKAVVGYYPQDHEKDFQSAMTLIDWMRQWGTQQDEQNIRSTLGKLLFSGDEANKSVQVLSGGEKGRMLYGKLMLQQPNVLIMDEPTNHMDMESIESLNIALEKYAGTLIFVSHDRQFVASLATQILELDGTSRYHYHLGNYDSYLAKQGIGR
ncbi:MAG: ABC-F family ATPase [Neisseriales bacterium]|nr:MAG: ABC-F family ATPase [Neisseriales bacterium]